jgi:SAM-dependent methyltransferase
MRTRESDMPDEETWDRFFDPASILKKLGFTAACGCAVEFGCGYGTFTIPAARIISGTLFAIDIDAEIIAATKKKVESAGLHNVQVSQRDFMAEGTGLPSASVDYVMLFNILHAEEPMILLEEAYRVLSVGGKVGIVHWNYDPSTPRGPSMSIRPRPEQCAAWAEQTGFQPLPSGIIALPPYHYGIVLKKAGGEHRLPERRR